MPATLHTRLTRRASIVRGGVRVAALLLGVMSCAFSRAESVDLH